jgi:hypothetical protein
MKGSTFGLCYDGPLDLDINAIEWFLHALTRPGDALDKKLTGKIFYVTEKTCDDEQRVYLQWSSESAPPGGVVVTKFFNDDGTVVFELGDDFSMPSEEITLQ